MLNRLLKSLRKYLFPQIYSDINGEDSFWQSTIKTSGVQLQKTIKKRGHSRGVFLVKHSSFGKCILKTSCAIRESRKGHADKSIAEIVTTSNPGIFPRIYDYSSTYTLEEFIDGEKFYLWMLENHDPSTVNNYFSELKNWSINVAGYSHNEKLKSNTIRFLCSKYIKNSMGQLRYLPRLKQLQSAYMISRRRANLARRINWLWLTADDIDLSKSMMCGDMGTKNILVETKTNKLYNIDYEYMSIGHFGFDAAYFTSSYLTNTADEKKYNDLLDLIITEEYMGGQECARFFRVLSKILSEIGLIVFHPESVR